MPVQKVLCHADVNDGNITAEEPIEPFAPLRSAAVVSPLKRPTDLLQTDDV